jgi:hypothetical protein
MSKWISVLPGICVWMILAYLFSGGWAAGADSPPAGFFDPIQLLQQEPANEAPLFGEKEEAPSWIALSGNLKFSSSCHFANDKPKPGKTDFRGINELKSSLFLRTDMDLPQGFKARAEVSTSYNWIYRLRGRGSYTEQTLSAYESDIEWMNCYVEGQLSDRMDVRVGRQVVAWGKSDSFRITDVLNPIDYLEPGRKELSESKLPVLMARLDYYADLFHLSVIAAPEHRWNRYPVFGSNFYPFDFSMGDDEDVPATVADMDYAMALNTSYAGSDMSLYLADYMDKSPYIEMLSPFLGFRPRHARVRMIGGDINYTWKNLLFKAEAAYFSGVRFSDYLDQSLDLVHISSRTYEKTQVLCGIEYMGFTDTYLALEAVNTTINGYDQSLEESGKSQNSVQISVKMIRSCFNGAGTFTLQSLFSGEKGQDGSLHQMKMSYDLSDDLTLTGGVLFFESGKNLFYRNLGDKDMLFLDLKYSF